ncbi:unnamed protein product [Closterium sp. Yama58-4]|nr:unnamed protein product [Closterium sp. Yama58-4]
MSWPMRPGGDAAAPQCGAVGCGAVGCGAVGCDAVGCVALRWELSEGGALPGWRESPIFFAPTYKYAVGSNRGSMSSSVGGYVSDALGLVSYSCAELALSDHRPVAAVFAVQVEAVERERLDAAVAVACRQLDERQQLAIPHCKCTVVLVATVCLSTIAPLHNLAIMLTLLAAPPPIPHPYPSSIVSQSRHGPRALLNLSATSPSPPLSPLPSHHQVPYASVIRRTIELHNLGTVPARFSVALAGSSYAPRNPSLPFLSTPHQVPYASVIRQTIELHNLGTLPARFSVAPAGSTDTAAPGPAGGCGAWVVAEPAAGAVAPGHTVTLSLHTWVVVPGRRVDLLVDRGGLLDLILVVAIAGGRDLFVACSGSYVPSCWGLRERHLEALAGLKDPIRSLSLDAIATRQRSSLHHTRPTPAAAAAGSIPEASETDPDNDNDSAAVAGEEDRPLGAAARAAAGAAGNPSHASDAFEVPKEVARMLTFLLDSDHDISSAFDPIALGIDLSLDQEDSTESTQFLADKAATLGAVAQELQIAPTRLALDTGTPFPTETSPLTMARALVSFLLALPEPIIPPSVGEDVARREGWARGSAATLLAERLGAVQLGMVDSLLALIQALLRNRIANRLAIHELVAILAYCHFGPVPAFTNDDMGIATATDAVRIVKRRRRFMRLLIEDTWLRSK